jgi:hypothetical protein
MGAPAIFEKQIEIKLLHPASTLKSRIQVKFIHDKQRFGAEVVFDPEPLNRQEQKNDDGVDCEGNRLYPYNAVHISKEIPHLLVAVRWSHGFRPMS